MVGFVGGDGRGKLWGRSAMLLALALMVGVLLSGAVGAQEEEGKIEAAVRMPLEVIFLANEGVLLTDGVATVVIDAFVTEPYSIYGALPATVWEQMLAGEGPFATVDLALVSHVHLDHFQGPAALTFLRARQETRLVTSPQVVAALREAEVEARAGEETPVAALPAERVTALELGEDGRGTVSAAAGGVEVTLLDLPHGGEQRATIQNRGHLVRIGEWTVLHVGDAELDAAIFAGRGVTAAGVDVAVLPYWYFFSEEGRRVLDETVGAAVEIATHIPPEELDGVVEDLAKTRPRVRVPRASLDVLRFDGTPRSPSASSGPRQASPP